MNINTKELKKRAIENLNGKWKICVLGAFIPFVLNIILTNIMGTEMSNQVSIREFILRIVVIVITSFLSFSFSVGVASTLLVDIPKNKFFPKNRHFLLMSLFGFHKSLVPVLVTKLSFSVLSVLFSEPMLTFFYDTLFFSYTSYYTYFAFSNVIYLVICIIGIYVSLGCAIVPYLIADIPFINGKIALIMSFKILKGHKRKLFLITLSLVGWYILGSFAFFVGIFFAMAYANAITCEYYKSLRNNLRIKLINTAKKPL